ncbi:MAG: hypothetical protein U1F19_01115 [Lysobacterales bacterium]
MNVVEQMLARYPAQEREHALREVMQEVALAGLQRGGRTRPRSTAAPACGIFHGLPRFSGKTSISPLLT